MQIYKGFYKKSILIQVQVQQNGARDLQWKQQKYSHGYKIRLPMGEKHQVNDWKMLTLGFGDCVLQYHFVVALIKQMCILDSDFLECWEADINFEIR